MPEVTVSGPSPEAAEAGTPIPGFVTDRLSMEPLSAEPLAARGGGEAGSWISLGIHLRENGERIGNVDLRFPDGKGGRVDLDIALTPSHQGNGLRREVLSPLFDYLFADLRTPVVRRCADPRDEGSHLLMRRLGMRRETLEVRSAVVGGHRIDRMHFALTGDRWATVRGSDRSRGIPTEEDSSDFWAVTSFFNPAGYRIHREKYRVFRDRIGIPLVAVELAYGDGFELGPGDADRLLRLRSDQVLWQKERLLNLAIQALPDEARFVAWVDADVVFDREDWAERTREALENHPIIQPYGRVHDLPTGADPEASSAGRALLTRPSLGSVSENGGFDPARMSTNMLEVGSPGHAWAMRRAQLEEAGLYDAMILGSGDNAMAMAALGHAEAYVAAHRMNEHEAKHYRRWAARFHEAAMGGIGFVQGDLYHLWHGDLTDRAYGERYPRLVPFRFNPEKDIALDAHGAWKWATHKPRLHEYVASYFLSRREDG